MSDTVQVHKRPARLQSMRTRMIIPMVLLVLLELSVLIGGIVFSGMVDTLDEKSVDTLSHTVESRKDYLQYEMVNRWCAVDNTVSALNNMFNTKNISAQQLMTDSNSYVPFLTEASSLLVEMMRENKVTGAFLVLRTGALSENGGEETLPTVYLRDRDPVSTYSDRNDDLLFEYGPIPVVNAMAISTDNRWRPLATMNPALQNCDAIYNPYRAAQANPTLAYNNLSYWSKPYTLTDDRFSAISFSVPLMGEDGTLYGVLGVEILTDYLVRQLPADEIDNSRGAYVLCIQEDGLYTPIVSRSILAAYSEAAMKGFDAQDTGNNYYNITTDALKNMAGCATEFSLYNTNTPYSDDVWTLFAVESRDDLFSTASTFTATLITAGTGAMALGIVMAILMAQAVTAPIAGLEAEVRRNAKSGSLDSLPRTGVKELDTLSEGIESLNQQVRRTEGKMSQVLEMSSINLGMFEMNSTTHSLFSSEGLFRVFGEELDSSKATYDSFEAFLQRMRATALPNSVKDEGNGETEWVCQLFKNDMPLWVLLKTVVHEDVTTGLAEDVTASYSEMRRLEYERDHDPLTGIYNRRAFYEKYHSVFAAGNAVLGIAALVMLDLDNLKYVNDTYGHDSGDAYIRAAAAALAKESPANAVVARMSGDEFMVFLYGYREKAQALRALDGLQAAMRNARMRLPAGQDYPVRVSAGVAWYPENTDDSETLARYADFAMYKGKHSTKGVFVDFNAQIYEQEAYLLQGKEAFNELIEQRRVDYWFQPIVEAGTGRVFGYEALMRPQIASLRNPLDVLALAREEGKLGAVEEMTWFCAMAAFARLCRSGAVSQDCHVFINSISSQSLSEDSFARFEEEYRPYLNRIVKEHTEEERTSLEVFERKKLHLAAWGGKLALDDYGTGYNGEHILVSTSPDFIKLDISIVRDIQTDSNKQQIVKNLMAYAAPRHIGIIAEGVETEQELRALLAEGVQYYQGYFLAKPAAVPPKPSERSVALLHEEYKPRQ